jgi:hypothetical protein
MDPQVISILEIVAPTVLGAIFICAAGAVSVSWISARSKRPIGTDAPTLRRIEERLDHLTNAVDAISVEVERISEGQRFTTKLLSDGAVVSVQSDSERAASRQ